MQVLFLQLTSKEGGGLAKVLVIYNSTDSELLSPAVVQELRYIETGYR